MRATFITLALEDGADADVIELRVTPTKKSRSAFDGYNRGLQWAKTCGEVAKLNMRGGRLMIMGSGRGSGPMGRMTVAATGRARPADGREPPLAATGLRSDCLEGMRQGYSSLTMKLLATHSLPTSMVALATVTSGVELVERPVPKPSRGEVLVQMHAAPINPNDLMFLDGMYEVKKPLGSIAGFEGSGTVVAAGGGPIARLMLGREVACAAGDGDGTWADYAVVKALRCAPVAKHTDPHQAAMLLTNPLTATVLLETARRAGYRAFIQNAAAGALGKMLVRSCLRYRLPLINIVRRRAQVDALRAIGAEHVVVADEPDAAATLRALCERLEVRFAFDAVAGTATDQLARALCVDGRILVYGMLSGEPCRIDADALVFRRLRVDGFTMYTWLEQTSMLGQLRTLAAAQRRLGDDLRSEIRATKSLHDHAEAISIARSSATDGKVLFLPRQR